MSDVLLVRLVALLFAGIILSTVVACYERADAVMAYNPGAPV